jgi:hypothetical protein
MKKTALAVGVLSLLVFQGCDLSKVREQVRQHLAFDDNRTQEIPIDSNIDLGVEKPGILYYADPKPEENGLNRVIRIDYNTMSYSDVAVLGTNPHSIDRAGRTDKFYIRTQDDYSFDVVNFKDNSVKTVQLKDASRGVPQHKPRAIGGYNDKYKIQLLSGKDMPTIDVIDVNTDTILATLGDENNNTNITTNEGTAATGHSMWFDADHFGLIDRANRLIRLYRVNDNNGTLSFTHLQDLNSTMPVHALERVEHSTIKTDGHLFYAMADGDVNANPVIAPSVYEVVFNDINETLCIGNRVVFSDSNRTIDGVKPTTHHAAITADKRYLVVPVLDGKVYFIDRVTMQLKDVAQAELGAAHVNVSKSQNVIIITNHFSDTLTFIDGTTHQVIKNLVISDTKYDPSHKHLLQPHFSYVSPDGRYYYTFATQDGKFIKIDLKTLEIVESIVTGGAPEQAHS